MINILFSMSLSYVHLKAFATVSVSRKAVRCALVKMKSVEQACHGVIALNVPLPDQGLTGVGWSQNKGPPPQKIPGKWSIVGKPKRLEGTPLISRHAFARPCAASRFALVS